MTVYRAIGLMSGTSLDGIDAAMIRTDGENVIEREGFVFYPYPDDLRARLRGSFNQPREAVRDIEAAMTKAHAEVVSMLLKETGKSAADVDFIGFHGQTIAHAPDEGYTCQIGDGALLAELTGISVINDFRTADVKAGGQGAPLAPVYHRALAADQQKPVAFLNIGGCANVTYIGSNGELLAFDTGPGNALIDDWVLSKAGKKYDEDGEIAVQGDPDVAVLEQLFAHPFFAQQPPKSVDRNTFVSDAWRHLSLEDGAATLSAFTVDSILLSQAFMAEQPATWIVCGGGRLNGYMMQQLQTGLGVPVVSIDTLGINGDAIEAEAFAYMAVRSYKKLPISFPGTTGIDAPMTGGQMHGVAKAA